MFDPHLIEADSYDREAFARASRSVNGLDELVARGERLVPHFPALLEDLFAALFKLVVRVKKLEETPKSTRINRQVLESVMRFESFYALKDETALDASRSAHAACDLARRALSMLKTGDMLLEEELLTAKALASEEEKLDQAKRAAEELGDDAGRLKDALKQKVEDHQANVDELGQDLDKALEDLPQRFTSELTSRAERLADDMPQSEDAADEFARAVGGQGPRNAGERLKLAEKLSSNDKLKKLARLAGAFRADARAMRKRRREQANTEVYRVGLGGNVGRLLPAELVALRHDALRKDFLRRLLEERLTQYDLRGDDHQGRGPVVVCVDGSGSMSGQRELWSKAVSLALLDIARRQGRRAHVIVFAGADADLSAFELTGRYRGGRRQADLDQIVKLAECFPGGGTDFQKPLTAALEQIQKAKLKGADVVFITDGEAQISPEFAEQFAREKKQRDISVYGVLVDDPSKNTVKGAKLEEKAARELGKVADWMTTVTQLTSGSVRELFRAL